MPAPPYPDVTVVLGDPRLADPAKIRGRFAAEDHDAFARLKSGLQELAEDSGYRFRFLDDHATLLAELAAAPPAFVFNGCDTGFRNRADLELHVPALLELLGVPYSGAPPGCLALCYDKAAVRAIAASLGVEVPDERFLRPEEPIEALFETWAPERFPVLVKPNRGDGSVGITRDAVADTPQAALDYARALRRDEPGREILVQEYLEGTEYGIGLVGNPEPAGAGGLTLLAPMEVDFGALPEGLPPILSYESKADPESPYSTRIAYRRAAADRDALERMARWSRLLFARLGCRDYARFDFRAGSDGRVRLLEANPNPAWCWDGKMAFMVGFAGEQYPGLLRRILEAAQARVHASRSSTSR